MRNGPEDAVEQQPPAAGVSPVEAKFELVDVRGEALVGTLPWKVPSSVRLKSENTVWMFGSTLGVHLSQPETPTSGDYASFPSGECQRSDSRTTNTVKCDSRVFAARHSPSRSKRCEGSTLTAVTGPKLGS